MKMRKNDLILLAAIVLLAGVVYLALTLTRSGGAYAVVTVSGAEVGRYSLSEDQTVRIGSGDSYNILVIENGTARISEASCPDKLCVGQGAKKYDGESIICLPNKVVVEIVGGGQSENDAVAR